MILERVEIEVLPGRETEFEAALCEVRQRVFLTRGFRGFTVGQSVQDPSGYLVDVLWETLEERAELDASGLFARCWSPVEPFLARALRTDLFARRESLDARGPGVITDMSWMADDLG